MNCFKCNGFGRLGFMGVASYPCDRCGGSGRDPNPTEDEVRRFNEPRVYSATQQSVPEGEGDRG